ncbi:MAG: sigma-70 family RNA polymerase sigma factor, partial [Nitrosomonas sp.]|nr:sigma-70 family RNA polymerase sigma factor [Nitrosomonas sp.]
RDADWLPRSIRKKMRRIEAAVTKLEQAQGCAPSEQELAEELEMTLDEYHGTLQSARGAQLIYFEDFQKDDEEPFLDRLCVDDESNPLNFLLDENLRTMVVNAIDNLPPREKMVMGMHYEQEMNLREIGEVLGVSESRVCQLHTQAIARLRSRLRKT